MAEPVPVAILVEDERQIRRFVRTALEAEGWSVHETDTLRQGLIDSGTRKPDLIILDLGMPDGDGMSFLRDLRGWSSVPVIVLSARVGEQDKIEALDAGADDYVTKPFKTRELTARIRAAIRRFRAPERPTEMAIINGAITLDPVRRRVERDGIEVHLTPREFDALGFLMAHAGRPVTHARLLAALRGPGFGDERTYLRVLIGQLRKKIEDDPANPTYLLTDSYIGYRFREP